MDTETAYRRSGQAVRDGYDASREMVQEYPLPAAVTVFALGFGLGVALGMLLTEEESYRYEGKLEKFGRQVLDAVAQVTPEALTRRFS
jgi:hypothetical protein